MKQFWKLLRGKLINFFGGARRHGLKYFHWTLLVRSVHCTTNNAEKLPTSTLHVRLVQLNVSVNPPPLPRHSLGPTRGIIIIIIIIIIVITIVNVIIILLLLFGKMANLLG